MKKLGHIILLIFVIPLCSFNSIEDSVKVAQIASDYPIIVRSNRDDGFFRISYPLVYRIHNSSTKIYTIRVRYYYGNPSYSFTLKDEWWSALVERNVNNEIISAYERGRLIIEGLETKEYIVYTGHTVPKKDSLQCLLETYINQKDSLLCPYKIDIASYGNSIKSNLGKISDFKKAYPDVVDAFLGKDSVMFGFFPFWEEGESNEYILPVKIDFDNKER